MPEKKRYFDETMKALQLVELRTKGGLILGERPMIHVRSSSMDRAARRYVRGLYRFEKGVRLPSDTPLRVLTDPAMVNEMSLSRRIEKPTPTTGGGTTSFVVACTP